VKAVVAVLALSVTAARADSILDAHRLSANPDTAAMSFFWRNKTHATLGAEIPLLLPEDTGGWSLRIAASVQLDNDLPNFLPNNYWRGLVGAELGHRFSLGPGKLASIAFLIQHESDHETKYRAVRADTPFGFYDLNSIGLHGDLSFRLASQQVTVSAQTRLHVLTCTVNAVVCASGSEGWGSQTGEEILEAVWDGPASPPVNGQWRPVVSIVADKLFPHGLVSEEHRFIAHAGLWLPTEHRGNFEFYAIAWTGNDVGFPRHRRITEFGLGFRWTP
jgi:hypothetical protein